jgi:hypothetical protein
VLCLLSSAGALAGTASGPRETIEQGFTTKRPNTPTGLTWAGRYHAEGDEDADPPYMRRMTFYPPSGMRYDTSVPEQCTASDFELSMNGPAACPEGSLIGDGTTEGVFFEPVAQSFVIDEFKHNMYIANNANEQIILVEAEGYSVVRGKFQPDGSLEFNPPTCFPTPPTGQCLTDHVLQRGSTSFIPRYTRESGSYATTPAQCPASGYWTSAVHFWWADGSEDHVVTRAKCRRSRTTAS